MSGQKLLRIERGFRPAEDQEGKNNRRQEDHYWSVPHLWRVCDACMGLRFYLNRWAPLTVSQFLRYCEE